MDIDSDVGPDSIAPLLTPYNVFHTRSILLENHNLLWKRQGNLHDNDDNADDDVINDDDDDKEEDHEPDNYDDEDEDDNDKDDDDDDNDIDDSDNDDDDDDECTLAKVAAELLAPHH